MEILLVAATRQEIAAFITKNPSIEFLITGIGMPATIYQLQKKLSEKKFDLVIQAGIAGSYSPELPIGTVTLVARDGFGDLGMEDQDQFTSIFEAGFLDADVFPYSHGWLVNGGTWFNQLGLPLVTGITVNKVSDSLVQKKQIQDHFAPDVESMEGAAFHFVCLQEQVPFLQVRSISNKAGVRNKQEWDIQGAITNLQTVLPHIISAANTAQVNQSTNFPAGTGVTTIKQ